MKKITTMVATLLIAAMSFGNVTTYAAETAEASRKFERPVVAENFKNFKADFDIEKIKSGEFSFEGKMFEGKTDKVFENAGNFKPGKFSFCKT